MPHTARSLETLRRTVVAVASTAIEDVLVKPTQSFREIVEKTSIEIEESCALGDMRIARNLQFENSQNAASILAENRSLLGKIESKLGPKRKFGRQGFGASALVLTFEDNKGQLQILRFTALDEIKPHHSWSVLSPHLHARFEGMSISVVEPAITFHGLMVQKTINGAEAEKINEQLSAEIYHETGLIYFDVRPENGCVTRDGRFAVIDPGAVRTEGEERQEINKFYGAPFFRPTASKMKARLCRIQQKSKAGEKLNLENALLRKQHITTDILNGFLCVDSQAARSNTLYYRPQYPVCLHT